MALTLVKTSVKLGVGVGAVYLTLDQGVWSNSQQSSYALQRFKTKVVPATSDYLSQVPSITEVKDSTVDNWNYGIHKVFDGIAASPDTLSSYSRKAVDEIKKSLK